MNIKFNRMLVGKLAVLLLVAIFGKEILSTASNTIGGF